MVFPRVVPSVVPSLWFPVVPSLWFPVVPSCGFLRWFPPVVFSGGSLLLFLFFLLCPSPLLPSLKFFVQTILLQRHQNALV